MNRTGSIVRASPSSFFWKIGRGKIFRGLLSEAKQIMFRLGDIRALQIALPKPDLRNASRAVAGGVSIHKLSRMPPQAARKSSPPGNTLR
jgi:hypothetical protein